MSHGTLSLTQHPHVPPHQQWAPICHLLWPLSLSSQNPLSEFLCSGALRVRNSNCTVRVSPLMLVRVTSAFFHLHARTALPQREIPRDPGCTPYIPNVPICKQTSGLYFTFFHFFGGVGKLTIISRGMLLVEVMEIPLFQPIHDAE